MFMLYLDLDELDAFFASKWYCSRERFNILSWRRRDYFGGEQPGIAGKIPDIKDAVISKVCEWFEQQGRTLAPIRRVCLLTHPRYFNVIFNPVSFYYCFDENDVLLAILAEITNTPWGERHAYVLPIGRSVGEIAYRKRSNTAHGFEFRKHFHVSPFNPMDMQYDWRFTEPADALRVHMENLMHENGSEVSAEHSSVKHFDATLCLKRQNLEQSLAGTLIRFPVMTVSVVVGIYWQALKLWFKRAPFYDHPDTHTTDRPKSARSP